MNKKLSKLKLIITTNNVFMRAKEWFIILFLYKNGEDLWKQ